MNFVSGDSGFSPEPRKERIAPGHPNDYAVTRPHQGLRFGQLRPSASVTAQPLQCAARTTRSSLAAVRLAALPRETPHGRAAGLAPLNRTAPALGRAARPRLLGSGRGTPGPRDSRPAGPRPASPGTAAAPADRAGQAFRGRLPAAACTPPPRPHRACASPSPGAQGGQGRPARAVRACGNPRAQALPRPRSRPAGAGKGWGKFTSRRALLLEEGRPTLPADVALVRLLRYVRVRNGRARLLGGRPPTAAGGGGQRAGCLPGRRGRTAAARQGRLVGPSPLRRRWGGAM